MVRRTQKDDIGGRSDFAGKRGARARACGFAPGRAIGQRTRCRSIWEVVENASKWGKLDGRGVANSNGVTVERLERAIKAVDG